MSCFGCCGAAENATVFPAIPALPIQTAVVNRATRTFLRGPLDAPLLIDQTETLSVLILGISYGTRFIQMRSIKWLSLTQYVATIIFFMASATVFVRTSFDIPKIWIDTSTRVLSWVCAPLSILQLISTSSRLNATVVYMLLQSFNFWYIAYQMSVFLVVMSGWLVGGDALLALNIVLSCWTSINTMAVDAMPADSRRRTVTSAIPITSMAYVIYLSVLVLSPLANRIVEPGGLRPIYPADWAFDAVLVVMLYNFRFVINMFVNEAHSMILSRPVQRFTVFNTDVNVSVVNTDIAILPAAIRNDFANLEWLEPEAMESMEANESLTLGRAVFGDRFSDGTQHLFRRFCIIRGLFLFQGLPFVPFNM